MPTREPERVRAGTPAPPGPAGFKPLLGMWIFLATELLLFGGLFLAYLVYRHAFPQDFARGSEELNKVLGTVNTGVLLTSSLTMALAVRAAESGRSRRGAWLLAATAALGIAFLIIKGIEYREEFLSGHAPHGAAYGAPPRQDGRRLFFVLYFFMTGLHALHLSIGVLVVATLAVIRSLEKHARSAPVEIAGLYWHFVDMIWIFLYPLLYLVHGHA